MTTDSPAMDVNYMAPSFSSSASESAAGLSYPPDLLKKSLAEAFKLLASPESISISSVICYPK